LQHRTADIPLKKLHEAIASSASILSNTRHFAWTFGSSKTRRRVSGRGSQSKCEINFGRLFVTFVDKEGDEHRIAVSKGNNLLEIAQAHDIEMEGKSGISYKRMRKC
jgi:predicted transcriptional regulator